MWIVEIIGIDSIYSAVDYGCYKEDGCGIGTIDIINNLREGWTLVWLEEHKSSGGEIEEEDFCCVFGTVLSHFNFWALGVLPYSPSYLFWQLP